MIYRGYSTSDQLQAMHDKAIAQRTQLKLKADTQTMEQVSLDLLQCDCVSLGGVSSRQ